MAGHLRAMAYAVTERALARRGGRHDHIVDTLIEERAPKLSGSPFWPLIRMPLFGLLHYGKARAMADAVADLAGRDALEHVSRLLSLKIEVRGAAHVPTSGRVLIIANHPTGIADGVALYDALKVRRPDTVFYANADAHRVSPGLAGTLIPVEWVETKRTRERMRLTLQLTREAMEAERPLVIFPAGRLARRRPDGVIADPEWATSAVSLARKYEAPVVPVHISGPTSSLFHFFNQFSSELRDVTLFHELLNKQGQKFTITFGPLIAPEALAGDAGEMTLKLKTYVENTLKTQPERPFA